MNRSVSDKDILAVFSANVPPLMDRNTYVIDRVRTLLNLIETGQTMPDPAKIPTEGILVACDAFPDIRTVTFQVPMSFFKDGKCITSRTYEIGGPK